jgi:hypothetical protein
MRHLHNLSIRAKLFLVIGLLLRGFGLLGRIAASTLNRTKVGGPLYEEVVLGKDLLADVLPPPLFIIEAYLTVHEIEDERDPARIQTGADSLRKLIAGFKERLAHWEAALPESELKRSLLAESSAHAGEFLGICETQFVPLVLDGKIEEAQAIVHYDLERLYAVHRASIDEAVGLATAFSAEQEARAREAVARSLIVLTGAGAVVALVVAAVTKGGGSGSAGGRALEGITAGSHEISGMVQSIAAATEEQSSASEEITRNIAGMAEGSQRNSEHAALVSRNAESLGRATVTLTDLVSKLKVEIAR